MKLQNLTVIFIVIILPIILIVSLYINTGIKTIKYQALYDTALLNATHDAIYAFEQNTANNKYSDNAETKRSIIKSSIKMFETSLANAAGISAYSSDEIEEYIPAIVFGLYDGFYMYAPSYNTQTGKYEHGLKNYVYYSETLDDGTVIRYSLDNYVSVTVEIGGQYYIKEGYLINLNDLKNIDSDNNGKADEVTTLKYKAEELVINKETINGEDNYDAIEYFKDAYDFSYWFLKETKIQEKKKDGTTVTYLNIGNSNDPENESSAFVQHKRKIIKEKMEGVLNSTITAYSNRTWGQNYKMPKLSEEDLEKIYNNISVTTFFQGKRIGLTKYNGYCVLNSTNSREYVNPNLMYFIDNTGYYHDIRCEECKNATTLTGYRIGSFGNKKVTDLDGNVYYEYDHNELACYECINGTENISGLVYNYITGEKPNNEYSETEWKNTKESYWTSLARERYNAAKLVQSDIIIEDEEQETYTVTYIVDGEEYKKQQANISEKIKIITDEPQKNDYTFDGWFNFLNIEYVGGQEIEYNGESEIKLYAKWKKEKIKVSYIKDGREIYNKLINNTGNYVIEELENIDKTNYIFKGWKYNIDGEIYKTGDNVQYSIEIEELVLTATYEQDKINVKYVEEDGITEIYSEEVDRTGRYTVKNISAPTKQYYKFLGWKFNGLNYGTGRTITYSTDLTEIVLRASYQKDYKITIQTLGKTTAGLTNSSVSYAKEEMKIIAEINQDVKITLEINGTKYENGSSKIEQVITKSGKHTITARATLNGETVSDTKTVYIGKENNNLDFKLGRLVTASGGFKCVFYDSNDAPFASCTYIIMSQLLNSQFDIGSIRKLTYKEDVKPLQGIITRERYYVKVFSTEYQGLTGLSAKQVVVISEDSDGNIISINILQGS